MTIHKPQKVFQFTSKVPEGDRHDAQFADHAKAITSTQDALNDIRRSDGALKNHIVTVESLHPDVLANLTLQYRQSISFDAQQAHIALLEATQERVNAALSADAAEKAAVRATQAADEVKGGAHTALAEVRAAFQSAQNVKVALDAMLPRITNAENDAALAAATAQDWADVSYHWAEYTAGTIPPNILAIMGITGDHWSSRWWANQASQTVQDWTNEIGPAVDNLHDFNKHYLGPSDSAPTVDGNGDPLEPGALYWNTTTNKFYVWTGDQWVETGSSGGGGINGGDNLGTGAEVYAGVAADLLTFRSLKFSGNFTVTQTSTEIQIDLLGGGSSTVDWANIVNEPTTLGGYGITDAYTKTEVDTRLSGKANTTHTHAISDVTGLQTALDGKANTTHGHAISDVTNLQSTLDGKAPLASPAFTGNPTAPTPATSDNDTSIATTAFVKAQGYSTVTPDVNKAYVDSANAAQDTAIAGKYDKAGGTLTGPSAPKRTSLGALSGTVNPDFATGNDFDGTISTTVTLGVPTNVLVGQSGVIFLTMAAGANLSFATVWDWEGGTIPTPSTTTAVDAIVYSVRAASGGVPSSIIARYIKAVA